MTNLFVKRKNKQKSITLLIMVLMLLSLTSCSQDQPVNNGLLEGDNWAEKLGFPVGKKVLILHADDVGMSEGANLATFAYLENKQIQSAAIMVPCPNSTESINWAVKNPTEDVGLHLTLTSEWKTYRWGTVFNPTEVPGLIDSEGKMWRSVEEVVVNGTAKEVEKEIRAQIDKAISLGMKPSHIDTHMGSLYGSAEFVNVFLKIAEEYNIPANAIELSNDNVAEHFRKAGYPINDKVIEILNNYKLPKLDFFSSVPKGDTYEKKREKFFELVKQIPNGLTEIIFHPSLGSEKLKSITNSWQQRIWEAEIFADPVVAKFFEDEEIIFTNWIEIMERFKKVTQN
jgi:predicted glycoside hydrolase/deacetylase ChbG (UPF0249 family)